MSCMRGISKQMLTLKTLSLPPSSPGSLTSSSACKSHKKRKNNSLTPTGDLRIKMLKAVWCWLNYI